MFYIPLIDNLISHKCKHIKLALLKDKDILNNGYVKITSIKNLSITDLNSFDDNFTVDLF